MEVHREVTALAGVPLPSTIVFDYPTVAEMADFVVSKLPIAITGANKPSPPSTEARAHASHGPHNLFEGSREPSSKAANGRQVADGPSVETVSQKVRGSDTKRFSLSACIADSALSDPWCHTAPSGAHLCVTGAGRSCCGTHHASHDGWLRLPWHARTAQGAEQVGVFRLQMPSHHACRRSGSK